MNIRHKIGATLLLTALLAAAPAQAQQISTSLPMTSVGSHLVWEVGDQTMTLEVGVEGHVRLDLFSPRLDQSDYRSADYYGDEQYDGNVSDVTTTFVLTDPSGREVLRRAFTPGRHDWETLIDQTLPAGQYRLRAVTQGNGKNTFSMRLEGNSAAVRADHLTVNLHSNSWVPVVNVATDGPGYALRMYDGDSAGELRARIRSADGRITPVEVSGDVEWKDLPLPDEAGQYVVELLQPAGAEQYSNTVGFALRRNQAPLPLTLTQVDETGLLEVTAELLLPTGNRPTQVEANVAGRTVTVDGAFSQKVAAGEYAVQPQPVPGARVSVSDSSVTVPKNGVGRSQIQVKPEIALDLQVDKPQVCVGDVVTLTGQASTDYRGTLPLDWSFQAEGLTIHGTPQQEGELSAATPARMQVEALAEKAGTYTLALGSDMWGQRVTRTVQVLEASTSVQLRRELPHALEPGQEGTVRVLLTNTGTEPASYDLTEQVSGLELLDTGKFSGTLAAGETKEVSYRVRALNGGTTQGQINGSLNSGVCPVVQTSGAQIAVDTPAPPAITRSSEVLLPFHAPAQARTLVVAHRLPEGGTYQPGSARLNGTDLPDPLVGPSGLLYWQIPASEQGQVSYTVNHEGALPALAPATLVAQYAAEREEVLIGQFDAKDFKNAREMQQTEVDERENDGAVRLPLDGTVYRTRDRISVTVEKPQGDTSPLLVNGQAVGAERIGTNTQDSERGVQRLTYIGVPLVAGPNTLSVGGDQIKVMLAASVNTVKVEPEQMIADGSTPLRVRVTALDEFGTPTAQPYLTIDSNLEPFVPDASASAGGYQIQLEDGVGVLELRPQTVPGELKLDVGVGQKVQTYTLPVRPDDRKFGVGLLSATVGLDGNFNAADDVLWTARGYYEGPIGDGKLFIAGDKDGLPHDHDPFERFPMAGDASIQSVPLQGIDPVAAVYDHPSFRATYQRTALPITVLPLGETVTAATLETKANPKVSAFAAAIPSDRVQLKGLTAIVPDGLRIVHLPNAGISRGSDSLELVVYEKRTGLELRRERLVPFGDYTIDYASGIVTLNRSIQPLDTDLNDVRIEAAYRLDNPLSNREWAYGAQVTTEGKDWVAGVAAVQMPRAAGDSQLTVGARAQYDNRDNLRAEARAAYADGFQASLDVQGETRENDRATLRARYQDTNYDGIGAFAKGFSVNGLYRAQFTKAISGEAEVDYRDDFAGKEQGYVRGVVDYRLQPFTVGGGLKYSFGDADGLSGVVRAGYTGDPVALAVEHEQSFSDTVPSVTRVQAGYKINENLSLKAQDEYTWGVGHRALLGADSRLGNTNFSVGYELPTAGGDGNRARFGVSTNLPLNKSTTLGLRGDAGYNFVTSAIDTSVGADLNYKAERYVATLGGDIGYIGKDGEWRTAVRGGISGSLSDELTLTADALAEFRAAGAGQRLTLGYAYRSGQVSSLGYARYINGTLAAGKPSLNTGLVAEYRQPNWAVRAGSDTRWLLNDASTFTGQAFVGGNYYLNDYFGVGAWGRAFYQPANLSNTLYGYGVEANLRALPGTWVSAGYNFAGFDGLPSSYTYTKPGAYLRLDLTLDEMVKGEK